MSITPREELLLLLEEKERRKARKSLENFPFYPKQKQFMNLITTYIALMAANQVGKCASIDSNIDTVDGPRRLGDLLETQEKFRVAAWYGSKKIIVEAGPVFEKPGYHECYRFTMEDGSWIECADMHRMLTQDGWSFVSEIVSSIGLRLGASSRPLSTGDTFRQVLVSGVPHWTRIPSDCRESYSVNHHRCDGRLPWGQDICQELSPSPDDALQLVAASSHADDLGSKCTSTHPQGPAHPSSRDASRRSEARSAGSLSRASCTSAAQNRMISQEALRPRVVEVAHLRSIFEAGASLVAVDDVSCLLPVTPSASNRIVSIEAVGRKRVCDFEVPIYHNYITANLVHHNSQTGCALAAMHLTGQYPSDYKGRRYLRPTRVIVGGLTTELTRDVLQYKLYGNYLNPGTGMIPGDAILEKTTRSGIPEAIDTLYVKHITGGMSMCKFKSAQQGRDMWQGSTVDFILVDEDFPKDVVDEARRGLIATGGQMAFTFSPIEGWTETTQWILDEVEKGSPDFSMVNMDWDDAPHLTAEARRALESGLLPHQIEARKYGRPAVGSGRIWPFAEEEIVIPRFSPEPHWKRLIAFDPGWDHPAAALIGAVDENTGDIYIYSNYKQRNTKLDASCQKIRSWGEGIPIVYDPAARQSNPIDGAKVAIEMSKYFEDSRVIRKANNAVISGLQDVYNRFDTGRLFITEDCVDLIKEIRAYIWNPKIHDKSEPLKVNDDLCACLRYLVASIGFAEPAARYNRNQFVTWKPADSYAGY